MGMLVNACILLTAVSWSLALAAECPSECRCSGSPARVDCRNAGLTAVPELPMETQHLDLSGNSISFLPNRSFILTPIMRTLDLSNNGLTKMEIDAFAQLGDLESLNLSHNNLDVGDFGDHELFRGCRLITELDISHNLLTEIPNKGFQVLTKLERLHMAYNRMTTPVFGPGFVTLDVLEFIDLSGNNFINVKEPNTGIPSHTFTILKDIRTVNLSNCNIHRIKPDVFRDLSSSLVHFDISDNPNINQIDLNATIHTVASSPYITTMRLSNVNLTDLTYVLTPLVDAENMQHLDLSHNDMWHLSSANLRPAQKLRTLNLSHNKLRDLPTLALSYLDVLDLSHNVIPTITQQNFEGAPDLNEIILNHNKLTEFSSTVFSRNGKLKKLDMSSNYIRSILDADMIESLEELDLSSNHIEEPSLLFQVMYGLQVLDLGSNKIDALTSDMIQGRIDLRILNLTNNEISNIQADTFKKWTPATVDLSNNRLSSIDDWGLSLIRKLYLSSNNIEYISEQGVRNWRYLTDLDLSDNRLNSLPLSLFMYLDDIRTLDLSDNNLGAFLMSTVGAPLLSPAEGMKIDLESLNLRSNNIKTIRDNYFYNLTVLQHLDLSQNQLTDIKSEQLQDLSLLRTLNLSGNRLQGFNNTAVSHLLTLSTLDLTGTEWSCDCSMAEVKKWMDNADVEMSNYDSYKCDSPQAKEGTLLKDFNMEEMNCAQTIMEKTIILIIIGCTSFVILVVAAIIFWQHRWRLKKKLKKQHYRAMYERAQTQIPTNHNTGLVTQTEYHHHISNHHSPHPYHHPSNHSNHSNQSHHSRNHTPILPQKPPPIPTTCPEHQHSTQAFV